MANFTAMYLMRMKRVFGLCLCLLCVITSFGQNVSERLSTAFGQFLSDPQLKQAMASLYVADANSGAPVFARNDQYGLAPASTQKVLTSVTAYSLLGRDFRYQTHFGLLKNGGSAQLFILPSGDPTLGSWRWPNNSESAVLKRLAAAVAKTGANKLGSLLIYNRGWSEEAIPNGWIWEDIGNYFGAGAFPINWRENQYDLYLRSGSAVGSAATVVATEPKLYDLTINSRVSAAEKGSGDQTLIYLPVLSREGVIRGTIPAGEQRFKVSGAMPNPVHQFAESLKAQLSNIVADDAPALLLEEPGNMPGILHTEVSPSMDSIVYWLNQKSINLYAEALVKTMAQQGGKPAATEAGIDLIKQFWKTKGIAETELNIQDGSGLSPQNRVTTKAQTAVLLFAKKQPWYQGLYQSLPLYNGMKMKSGTIGGVKGFTGYHTSKTGITYAFSFLVNNYNGTSSALVQKMYRVLDELK